MTDMRETLQRQIIWNRLIALVEEQAQVLLKTAFGPITREAGDLSAGVYDARGRMLAQAVTGTPGHVNTMAMAVAHFLDRFPIASMRPGDVYATNDPWLGTGHLFDFVIVTPAFIEERLVGFFASTCHVIDIGGKGFSADATTVYEEGLLVPHMRIVQAGELNRTFFDLLAANVREPEQVRGDLLSLISCNAVAAKRLGAMMREFRLESLDAIGEYIVTTSRDAMLAAIRKLPRGTWRAEMPLDGYESPILLRAALTVHDGGMRIDYEGSSPASRYGINSPKCYTDAYSMFGVKCAVAPEVPNNAGSLSAVEVVAPRDSIVNPDRPRAVTARHVIGQMLPELMFGCLEEPLGGNVPAEGAGSIWVLAMSGGPELPGAPANATRFNAMSVGIGGMGARPAKDGLSTTAFPSGVGSIPVEVTESQSPLIFKRREFLTGSGGDGRTRGGLGSIMEVANTEEAPFAISLGTSDRRRFPARGRCGGKDGRPGKAYLLSGGEIPGKQTIVVPAGEAIVLELPGGGGYGSSGT